MSKDHQEKDKGKKGKREEDRKKYDKRKIITKNKKKNKKVEVTFLTNPPSEEFVWTNPPSEEFVWWQALVLGLVKNCPKKLDRVGNTYKLSKCCFTWLKSKETINSIW